MNNRGMGFVLAGSYRTIEDARLLIDEIPLYQYIIIDVENGEKYNPPSNNIEQSTNEENTTTSSETTELEGETSSTESAEQTSNENTAVEETLLTAADYANHGKILQKTFNANGEIEFQEVIGLQKFVPVSSIPKNTSSTSEQTDSTLETSASSQEEIEYLYIDLNNIKLVAEEETLKGYLDDILTVLKSI